MQICKRWMRLGIVFLCVCIAGPGDAAPQDKRTIDIYNPAGIRANGVHVDRLLKKVMDEQGIERPVLAANFPDKRVEPIPVGRDAFGEINRLFHAYLMEQNLDFHIDANSLRRSEESIQDVYYGFFELKKVFQLRTLKLLWNARADTWHQVMENSGSGEKGTRLRGRILIA